MRAERQRGDRRVDGHDVTAPIGTVTEVREDSVGLHVTWQADPAALQEYLEATFSGYRPPRSRWERLLIWFGLRPAVRPYTHTFSPMVLGPPATVTELWGDWRWEG